MKEPSGCGITAPHKASQFDAVLEKAYTVKARAEGIAVETNMAISNLIGERCDRPPTSDDLTPTCILEKVMHELNLALAHLEDISANINRL